MAREQIGVQRPRIVMMGSWPPNPGISAYCFELAHAVGGRLPVHYLAFHRMYPGFLYPAGAAPRDDTFPPENPRRVVVRRALAWYNPFGWIWEGFRASGDVLHAQFWSLPLAPVIFTVMLCWRLRGKPAVLTIHNLAGRENRRWFHWSLRSLVQLASAIIVHTSAIPDWLARHCERTGKRLWTIPHGTLDLYEADAVTGPAAREHLGISPQASVVLFFGAIRPYKGLDVLLRAFARVARRRPEALLVIAGRPWEAWDRYDAILGDESLRSRTRLELGYIPTKDVKLYFAAADVVALPYREFEAQSGVALTAIAFRKPLVVSAVGELAALQPDHRFVVPAEDVTAWVQALERLLAEPALRERLAASSAEIAKELGWEAIAEQTIAVYRSLCPSNDALSATRPPAPLETVDPRAPKLSIIVITMNRSAELAQCLANLQRLDDPGREIIVVDNRSTDDTRAMVARDFPEVRLVPLGTNQGVSGGRNRGAEVARGEVCVFLDDDAEFLDQNALTRIERYFERDQRLACLGFTILDPSGQEEAKSIPRVDKRPPSLDYPATYFCGAGFAVRRRPFIELGMFWEPLVYGGQELDLSYRILDQGYSILHSTEVRVLHKSSQTARPNGQWVYFNARDRGWVAARNLPWRYVVTTTCAWWAYTAWVAARRAQWRHFARGVWDACLGFPSAIRTRRRIGSATLRTLTSLSGRTYY